MKYLIFALVILAVLMCAVSCTNDNPAKQSTSTVNTTNDTVSTILVAEPIDGDYEPGVILLGMKEPYTGDVRALFPDLVISKVEDSCLTFYNQIKNLPNMEQVIEDYKSRIGTSFVITLTDTSKAALASAIAVMKDHPLVSYAIPNYYNEPAD